ncbi:MAG: ribonuclease R [Candidatus Zixiibacteriota bacterium]
MAIDKEQVLKYIRTELPHPMKIKELASEMSIPTNQYAAFRRVIKDLIDSGELVRLRRGRVGPASQLNIVVGTISITRGGTGFVKRDDDTDEIVIPSSNLSVALDGDRVQVRLGGTQMGRPTGTVIKVLQRVERNIVGVYRIGRSFAFVVPDNPRIHRDIYIPGRYANKACDGEKVVARLLQWDDECQSPEGKVIERLGMPGSPGIDMLAVARNHNLPLEFPARVLSQAEAAAAELTKEEMQRREDLTGQCIYTIDPADAKDHDDAISVERTPHGYKLGVHIADVAHFVKEGSLLDTEAFERGNSVYLPGMVVPMLPEALSNDVCSLRPNRKRLAHSVFIEFDSVGKVRSWRIADTVIRSRAKLSYEEVQAFFNGKDGSDRVWRVSDNLTVARELAQLLYRRRSQAGSLDFDLPESKITLDREGRVLELSLRERLESHRLVEEFMLAANKAVAMEVFRKAQPFLYRVHDRPDLEKLEHFSDMVKRLGHRFSVSPNLKPAVFARFLDRVKGTPEEGFVNELMLRSMKKACYQRENIGHFGLAFSHYTHFTSPIRRYADLLVHRLLRKLDGTHYPPSFATRVVTVIDHVGSHCSATERTAEAAEREAIKVKQVSYMVRHVGAEFTGIITGVIGFGFFVRLDDLGVEGLVRMSSIDDDFYRFDEEQYAIIGRRHRKVYRLGDSVKVGIMRIDPDRREIDLFLAKHEGKSSPSGRTAPRKNKLPKRERDKVDKAKSQHNRGGRNKRRKRKR